MMPASVHSSSGRGSSSAAAAAAAASGGTTVVIGSTSNTSSGKSSKSTSYSRSSSSNSPPPPGNTNSTSNNTSNSAVLGGTSRPRSKSSKKGGAHFSRSYPRGVGIDFRKLSNSTLMSYIDHHGVSVRDGAPPSELAVGVARHFEAMDVDEEWVIGGFLSRLMGDGTDYIRQTAEFDGLAPNVTTRKRRRSRKAARPGEQVAAKITRTDENGSWILASVQRFYPENETYDVQDEDDPSKLIRLPWNHVMRLSTGTEGCFVKGAEVMAIFPETTSFYRAVVSKQPVWKRAAGGAGGGHAGSHLGGGGDAGSVAALQSGTTHSSSSSNSPRSSSNSPPPGTAGATSVAALAGTPMVRELIVKFEDDEDETKRTPHRRVPSRYVIPVPSTYFFEDEDDVDLTPPGTTSHDAL